jgi:CubicO group peptidase (beta-lactamase class C family)
MRTLKFALGWILVLLVLAASTLASDLEAVKPGDVGLNSQRLAQLSRTFQDHVDEGQIAGALLLIGRRGQVAYCETVGYMDLEARKPMQTDSIFRIASMTKAVTAVAVLQLMEQGHFMLDDPVSKYIPEFKDMKVAIEPNQVVATDRPITIRDLLRHTSGIAYGGKAYRQAGLNKWDRSLSEFVGTLCKLPLASQPGARFRYSYSTDVLGYLVEVVSGRPLDEYFEQSIFEPLAMHDTGFVVPQEKVERLTNHYRSAQGKLLCEEQAAISPFLKRAEALSGGGGWSYSYPGLVTTAKDWWRFMEMLRRHGQLDGQRVLSRPTVKLMCADHLGDAPGAFEPGTGHGLAVGIVTDAAQHGQLAAKGTIYWAGGPHNTYYFVNFKEQMCGLMFMQNAPFGHLDLMRRFLVLAHQAIDD